jgi:hypothetical protein
MPDFKLADLERCIDEYNQSKYQLLGIKQRLDRIRETDTTPQLDRVLEKMNSMLVLPISVIEPIVSDDITMVAPLLDKLEMKL